MQRRLQAPPALPSQEMTEANPAALAERAGDTALDFLTARAPTFFTALAERAGGTALDLTFLPPKLPFATAAPLTVACRAGDFGSTPTPPRFFVSVHSRRL